MLDSQTLENSWTLSLYVLDRRSFYPCPMTYTIIVGLSDARIGICHYMIKDPTSGWLAC